MAGPGTRRRPRPAMSRRVTNLTLLAVVTLVLLTGLGSWLVPTPAQRTLVVAHGVGGLLVLLLVRWKAPIIRSGLRRSRWARWASVVLAGLTVIALLSGVLHSTGLAVRAAGQLMMWWHVAAGLLLLPLLVWHAWHHRQPVRGRDLDRRLVLRHGLLLAGAGVAWLGVEGATAATGLPGARRRPTGSYLQPLPQPTIWLADPTPTAAQVEASTWRLRVRDGDGERTLSVADVRALPAVRTRAVIDCTSGWASEQDWTGVPLASLLGLDGTGTPAGSVRVTATTGYWRRFAPEDLDGVLLAYDMADEPLLRQLGAPLRLVVPGRRGFWWVKWVASVEVEDAPAWWQPPVPLQ